MVATTRALGGGGAQAAPRPGWKRRSGPWHRRPIKADFPVAHAFTAGAFFCGAFIRSAFKPGGRIPDCISVGHPTSIADPECRRIGRRRRDRPFMPWRGRGVAARTGLGAGAPTWLASAQSAVCMWRLRPGGLPRGRGH